jgi:HPt (histidine-containing phosphotransfer) domain-containing protein
MRVLLLDNNDICKESIIESLKEHNITCDLLFDYSKLWGKLDEFEYDCIIINVELIKTNGIETVKKIKEKYNEIVIIGAVAGIADKKDYFLAQGFDRVLNVPFTKENLLKTICPDDMEQQTDTELLNEMLKIFYQDSVKAIQTIKSAYKYFDWNAIAYESHKLKGAASYVFADKIKSISAEINNCVKSKQYDNIQEKIEMLDNEIRKFIKKI